MNDLNVVLGAGPVGRALVERLAGQKRPTRVVTRSGTANVPEGVEVVAADITQAGAAERACEGAGVVFGCVGLPSYEHWPESWPPLMDGMLRGAETAERRSLF